MAFDFAKHRAAGLALSIDALHRMSFQIFGLSICASKTS